MSGENVEIAEHALALLAESYRTGTVAPALLELCSPEIRIDASRRVFNPDVYDGHDGLRRLVREICEAWEGFTETTERLIDAPGNRVVVLQRISGRGRASGAKAEMQASVMWTMRDGRAVRVDVFLGHGALEAAGLG